MGSATACACSLIIAPRHRVEPWVLLRTEIHGEGSTAALSWGPPEKLDGQLFRENSSSFSCCIVGVWTPPLQFISSRNFPRVASQDSSSFQARNELDRVVKPLCDIHSLSDVTENSKLLMILWNTVLNLPRVRLLLSHPISVSKGFGTRSQAVKK